MGSPSKELRPVSMADSEKTATQSHEPSVFGEKSVAESAIPATATSVQASENIIGDEKATVEEKTESKRNSTASATEEEDDFEYPTKGKLAAITLALCLSVFCMALVGNPRYPRRRTSRTTTSRHVEANR